MWIFDSGASVHINPKKDEINGFILSKAQSFIKLPDGFKLPIIGKGSITFNVLVNNKPSSLTINDVRYIPALKQRILSEVALAESGFRVIREGNIVKVEIKSNNDEIVAQGTKSNQLGAMYTLDIFKPGSNSLNSMTLNNAHESLGHIDPKRIIEMAKSMKYNITLSDSTFTNGDSCSSSKLSAPSQPKESSRIAANPGEIINANIIGPIP